MPAGLRHTREYDVVYDCLINAARKRSRAFYAELAGLVASIASDEPPADVSELLREVAHAEHAAGRPLLTALAVTGKSIPGNVFFTSARELGLLTSNDPAEEMRFWMEQERRVYEAWDTDARDGR
jgi:hypothetical protein